jgi:peptidoglycan/xylan/chitin deacetylase (PgdA/CDA1 family)
MAEIKAILTFDDGPHTSPKVNYTAHALAVLRENQMKGAFFIQTHVPHRGANPIGADLIRKMHAEGHVVGIHTGSVDDHESHIKREDAGALRDDLDRAKKRLVELGIPPKYVRPVKGECDARVLQSYKTRKLKLVLWDIDSKDSHDGMKPDLIARHLREEITRLAKRGRLVILFHELDPDTRGQIKRYIDTLTAAARSAGHKLTFPTTRREIEQSFDARSDEAGCKG